MSESDIQTIEIAAELYAVKYELGTSNKRYEFATKLIMRILADVQTGDRRIVDWLSYIFKGFNNSLVFYLKKSKSYVKQRF